MSAQSANKANEATIKAKGSRNKPKAEFVVRCPDFAKPFATREAAERWIVQVEASGYCRHEHAIQLWDGKR